MPLWYVLGSSWLIYHQPWCYVLCLMLLNKISNLLYLWLTFIENHLVLSDIVIPITFHMSAAQMQLMLYQFILIIMKFGTVWLLMMLKVSGPVGFCTFWGLQMVIECKIILVNWYSSTFHLNIWNWSIN